MIDIIYMYMQLCIHNYAIKNGHVIVKPVK